MTLAGLRRNSADIEMGAGLQKERTDGRKNGQRKGRKKERRGKDERREGRREGQTTDGRKVDGWTIEGKNEGESDVHVYGWKNGRKKRRTDGRTDIDHHGY